MLASCTLSSFLVTYLVKLHCAVLIMFLVTLYYGCKLTIVMTGVT